MKDNRKKLDARGRRMLETLAPDTQVELLMRLDADPDPDQLQTLRQIGCHVASGAGNVLTARVNASKLAELTELPFINSLQLSREVFEEDT
jgi:hypothetical protein